MRDLEKQAEHRKILRQAPAKAKKPLKDLLLAMPPVGEDADFERSRDSAPLRDMPPPVELGTAAGEG